MHWPWLVEKKERKPQLADEARPRKGRHCWPAGQLTRPRAEFFPDPTDRCRLYWDLSSHRSRSHAPLRPRAFSHFTTTSSMIWEWAGACNTKKHYLYLGLSSARRHCPAYSDSVFKLESCVPCSPRPSHKHRKTQIHMFLLWPFNPHRTIFTRLTLTLIVEYPNR